MIKVSNQIPTYDEPATPDVRVHSHWNESRKVVIEVDGKEATVDASELIAAVENATNVGR